MNLSKRNICISKTLHLLNVSVKRDLNIENSGKIPLNKTYYKSNKYPHKAYQCLKCEVMDTMVGASGNKSKQS